MGEDNFDLKPGVYDLNSGADGRDQPSCGDGGTTQGELKAITSPARWPSWASRSRPAWRLRGLHLGLSLGLDLRLELGLDLGLCVRVGFGLALRRLHAHCRIAGFARGLLRPKTSCVRRVARRGRRPRPGYPSRRGCSPRAPAAPCPTARRALRPGRTRSSTVSPGSTPASTSAYVSDRLPTLIGVRRSACCSWRT